MRIHSRYRGHSGFSLIEVMIAVIVLATGLLALAALQINLTSSSADAKARSRIASLLASTIDDERAAGLAGVTSYGAQTCLATGTTLQKNICFTQTDAGVSGLQVAQTMTEYYGLPGGSSFTTSVPGATATIYGDYKLVQLSATWTDATGGLRSLNASTIASNLGLNSSNILPALNLTFSANLTPVVHETNPGSANGVIPIAIGNNSNTASTNPKPTVNSSGANATTFTTLTYGQGVNDTSLTSTIQKRVETEVAECVCQGSSSNPFATSTLFGQNTFRPTYWNGTQYVSPAIVPSGVPHSSHATSITQSAECDVCCRDHNDTGVASGQVLYDSVTTLPSSTTLDTHRYKVATLNNGTITTPVTLALSGTPAAPVIANVTSDAYLDACRIIRVDGLWRVATDIEASHVGLVVTNDENGISTNPGNANTTYDALYQNFVVDAVKHYLNAALPTAGSPEWSNFLSSTLAGVFSTYAPNVPSPDPVTVNTTGTYRYLHAHGLYIDHLETAAITKLNALESSSCTPSTAGFPTCLLANLPFNTINLSGLAGWTDTATDGTSQAQPDLSLGNGTNAASTCATGTFFGGCVLGLRAGQALALATIGHSNSGIAQSLPVNPYELLAAHNLTASQRFDAGATLNSDQIFAQVFGPDLTPSGFSGVVQFATDALNQAINPAVTWATGIFDGNCQVKSAPTSTPNPYSCDTPVTLAVPTTITVGTADTASSSGHYNQIVPNAATSVNDPCGVGTTITYPIPGLVCYSLSTATLSTDAAGSNRIDCNVHPTPASCYNIASTFVVSHTKTLGETTAVTISSVTGTPVALTNTYLNLTYVANGSALGTVDTSTCATSGTPIITTPTSCP